jgi:hypothetical protein
MSGESIETDTRSPSTRLVQMPIVGAFEIIGHGERTANLFRSPVDRSSLLYVLLILFTK